MTDLENHEEVLEGILSNEESRRDPFKVCQLNIRYFKIRDFRKGSMMPRIMVLSYDNVIRMLTLDAQMKWNYDESAT